MSGAEKASSPASSLSLRRCTPADAALMARLGAETFMESFGHLYDPRDAAAYVEKTYGLAQTVQELEDASSHFWLLEEGGEDIGYAKLGLCKLPLPEGMRQCPPHEAYELHRLYIRKPHQGGGHGPLLLKEAMRLAARHGARELYVGVWSENHRALALYERHGFKTVADYWFEVGSQRDDERIMKYIGNVGSLL